MKTPALSEADIQANIRLATGRLPDVRLFRNNRGVAWMGKILEKTVKTVLISNPRRVEFGLTDGASDLIGLKRVVITQAMVGQTVALFVAAEVKKPGETVPDHQQNFVDFVAAFGGVSGVVRSPEDALRLVTK